MPPFSAKQMAQWLYVKRITEIDAMTDLSKRARAKLAEHGFTVGRQQPLTAAESSDGTVKYLFEANYKGIVILINDKDPSNVTMKSIFVYAINI